MKKEKAVATEMTSQQRKYVMRRAEEIRSDVLAAVKKSLTTKGVRLSDEKKYDLIAGGEVKLLPKKTVVSNLKGYGSTDLNELYDFSKHESKTKVDEKKLEIKREQLDREYQKLCDEVMLGSSGRAMELLKKFESLTK